MPAGDVSTCCCVGVTSFGDAIVVAVVEPPFEEPEPLDEEFAVDAIVDDVEVDPVPGDDAPPPDALCDEGAEVVVGDAGDVVVVVDDVVVVGAAWIANCTSTLAVAEPSVAVIVTLEFPATDGVPVIDPVVGFNTRPVGNVPAVTAYDALVVRFASTKSEVPVIAEPSTPLS